MQNEFNILRNHLEVLRFKRIIFKYTKNGQTFSKSFTVNSLNDSQMQ
jgi:hypothetical protein